MTNTPEPAFGSPPAGPTRSRGGGSCSTPTAGCSTGERTEFPTRSDAETWLGEAYPDLAEDGVAAVTLFEGDREVYGPMSLEAG